MSAGLLQSPAGKAFDSPVGGPPRNAPPSPALSREQIKNRSSRGWSTSNGNPPTNSTTSSGLSIPPLNFRSKHPTSSAMGRTDSSESTTSSINGGGAAAAGPGMSPLDAGSPFGNILGQFQSPQVESARKSSGSFKILEKKAVSNSPFLTGGNTRSATGANYSPASTTLLSSPRKPFAPSSGFASWRNDNNNNGSSNPPSPARNGLHGLGVFSSSSSSSPVQNTAPAFSASNRPPQQPTHRRNNSDVENLYPEFRYDAQETLANNNKQEDRSQLEKVVKPDVSPATQFNAEMESLGQPRAIDITRGRSDSEISSAGLLPQLHTSFGNGPGQSNEAQSQSQKRKPRPSVATLGNRATVSNSPFLSQGGPLSPGLASTLRQDSRDAPFAMPVSQIPLPQPTSALTSPRRNMLGPREPSLTDLKARAEEQDILSEYYNDDEPLSQLTEHALERKASKKSVKWAEMEEVCEYDVMTEDGDTSSRRSSSTGSFNPQDEYGDTSFDDDEETKAQVQEILRQHGVQDLNVFGNGKSESVDDFYDETQHATIGARLSEELDTTPGRSRQATVKLESLSRDASFVSEQASVLEIPEADRSGSSFEEHDGEAEIQQLIDQVEAASMTSRPLRVEDVFGSPMRQDEFGVRTPHSSIGAESTGSSALGTPQPLNRNGSLSRRPLPSPPVIGMGAAGSPAGSPSKTSERSRGDSTERHSFLLQTSTADDSLFSLPDLGLTEDAIFDLKEMGLSRKESLKRSPGINCYNGGAPPSPFKPILEDAKEVLLPAAHVAERSISPKPFLTAEDVRNSLRRKPSALAHLHEAPLASTPPAGSMITSTSKLPSLSRQSSDDTPTNSTRSTPKKAISARPAPPPMKISSDQLPTFNTSPPQPSPIKEPESALDRLVREAAAGNAEAVHALKGDWAQAYSTSGAKDAARQREEAIIAAKRAKKGLSASAGPARRRRSLSTGDVSTDSIEEEHLVQSSTPKREVDALQSKARQVQTAPNSAGRSKLADQSMKMDREAGFSTQLGQALDNVVDFHDRGYRVREQSRGVLAYDGSTSHRISTVGNAGDIDAGGAWRKIRRPSDIYEHRTQIREYKQASASKARNTGALFVKIGKLKLGRDLPIPAEPTFVSCELFNGLDHVTTGVSRLGAETEIQQEFELIAHPNLEVTLAFKIRKDPSKDRHLFPRPQSVTPASPSSKHAHTGSTSGGFRTGLRNLLSSPKKNKVRPASAMDIRAASPSPSFPAHPLLDYLASDGELCRVAFKSETFLPSCTGKRIKTVHQCRGPERSRRIAGSPFELEISLFYLPPLPNVPVDKMPQSIDECLDGILKAERHDKMLFQGILTQMGADCAIWRRRWFTLKGTRLIAYNEVTRQAHAVFDLAQAVKLDDPDEEAPSTPANSLATPATASTGRSSGFNNSSRKRTLSYEDDEDPFSTRPNSFRVHFEDGTFIDLCADADKPEEKAKWLVYLKPIINRDKKMRGFGPPPLWAQTLREMLDSKAKKETQDKPPLPRK